MSAEETQHGLKQIISHCCGSASSPAVKWIFLVCRTGKNHENTVINISTANRHCGCIYKAGRDLQLTVTKIIGN